MDIIKQIRQEIERRIKVIKPQKGQGFFLCEQLTKQLQDLLSFLDTLEKESESVPKIKGWIARDKADRIGLYDQKPKYNQLLGTWEIGGDWIGRFSLDGNTVGLDWQSNEPEEVELTIKKI